VLADDTERCADAFSKLASKVKVSSIGVSLDGYAARVDQSVDNPMGVRSMALMLAHHARAPIPMLGGTTFHCVTEGINLALAAIQAAAGGRDVRIGGWVATIRSYLKAGLVDEVHLAIAATALGKGARKRR
jgi:dihydrofolate reductase